MKGINFLRAILYLLSTFSFVLLTIGFSSCVSRKANNSLEIGRLFMQTAKPEIAFVNSDGIQNSDGSQSVSEQVSFNQTGMFADEDAENEKLDTSKVYELSEVVVETKINYASERDGKATVDFKIIAPTDIIDPNWRLYLAPKLIDRDSICYLDTVIITGEGFKEKQVDDYDAYKDFIEAIVDPSAYDSLFIDWKGLDKEILKIQNRNYNEYREEYNKLIAYENWKRMNEMEFLDMEALAMRHKRHLYERYWRKAEKESLKNLRARKDTAGILDKHIENYKKDYVNFVKNKFSLKWLEDVDIDVNLHNQKDSVLVRSYVPKTFRYIHENGVTLNDIYAKPFTKEDSAKIAKRHYLIDEIVLNEMNINRKDDVFKEIVQFPYQEDVASIRVDTIISGEDPIIYHYKQTWKVQPGMKNLKIVLNGKVEAIDRSMFEFPNSDTLTFLIASLSQMVDESLVTKRENLKKHMFQRITVYPNYKSKKAYKWEEKSNQGAFDKLIEACNVYTSRSEFQIDSITIHSSSDLKGDWTENYNMSYHRANAVSDYLKNKIQASFSVNARGEDWNTLAKEIQGNRSSLPNASEILELISRTTVPDKTEEEIRTSFPEDYAFIEKEIYPKLQRLDFLISISRTDIEKDTIKVTYREEYAEGVRLLKEREYRPALEILANYPDYNTALCLVSLGYNDKALKLLSQLPKTAKNDYLLAVIHARNNDKQKAANYLMNACSSDPDIYHRISLDSELSTLVTELNLWKKLAQLSEF